MIKEKHLVNGIYGGHQLARYIDVYEVSANRCHSVPESGYKGTVATLVDEPAWNEKFSSYSITGATLTGNNFVINNDVTAQAVYETAKNLTLQTDGHGTIAANKMSGFIGDTAALSNTASNGYGFSGYSITGATLTGSNFKFTGSDITAKAWFSAVPTAYNGSYDLTSYYDPRSSNPGYSLDELMAQTRQFVLPIGNMGVGTTRKYYITPYAADSRGYKIYTGNILNSIVLGSNRRLSGSITADIRYISNIQNAVCIGVDPNYTTYYEGTTKKYPNQWTSATIVDTQHCSVWGQGGYTHEVKVFNIDISNAPGTLFIATSASQSVYVNSLTANLIETRE